MNEIAADLVKLVLGKDSLEACTLQELQQITREYPYFTAAQVMLAEKMRSQHPQHYIKQLQKTSLFFRDPIWFDYLLNKQEYKQEEWIIQDLKSSQQDDEVEEEIVTGENEDQQQKIVIPVEQKESMPEAFYENDVNDNDEIEDEGNDINAEEIDQPTLPALNVDLGSIRQEMSKPVEPSTPVITFEPYHTVDYFASQGIRLSAEEKNKDKFGQQLKSFTEWLKTMKKLPATEIGKQGDPVSEEKVQTLAEHSLKTPEVLTESMAEVWEKQGQPAKAIEIYEKLSLGDPSKSAYFAAKIDQLKKS